jgi:glycosyltransferase involved in cell wall biosynthesis
MGLPDYNCITYCALPYNGRGWSETCVSVLKNFPATGLAPTLVLPRASKVLPANIRGVEALTFPFSLLPWQVVGPMTQARLDKLFRRQIALADPARTIAYFWPGTPIELVKEARRAGILTIRQMINTFQGAAKRILDDAYSKLSIPTGCSITWQEIERETDELAAYDYVFAPAPGVEHSLREAGVAADRIVSTSFGWSPSRFTEFDREPPSRRPLRFLFVGLVGVRKGIPALLEAWKKARIEGELVIVGDVEAAIQTRVDRAVKEGSVRHVTFTDDVGAFYRNSDVFVFPTLEEGCPQVTMEAGGCGLPVITTEMGAGHLVKDKINGLIVEADNVGQLIQALQRMARDAALRTAFAERIERDAAEFAYDKVSEVHARTIVDLLERHARRLRPVPDIVIDPLSKPFSA